MFRRTILTLAVLSATTLYAAPTSRDTAWAVYQSKLARTCGDKHLEWLAPADLNDMADDFQAVLPLEKQQVAQSVRQQRCSASSAGMGCDNTGFLKAIVRLGELDHFVEHLCSQPEQCSHQSVCTEMN